MAWGHDAPAQVTVHMQMRAVGGTMRAYVRVPLEAVRDVAFPTVEGGYLDVAATAPLLPGLAKVWVADAITVYEGAAATARPRVVGTQISLPADRSFATYEAAEERMRAPLPENRERLFWKQVFFDVALEFPLRETRGAFAVHPAFANLGERVDTVLHYGERTYLLREDQEAFPLEPSWAQASWLFVKLGFVHILEGTDHLLFLLCLVIANRRFRSLVGVATAFTVAHSLTLVASAMGWTVDAAWFPPAVELAIAASIVYVALANIVGGAGHASWPLAFGFGLVHGFGFSFALRESMQFAGAHLGAALFAFNVGVELGQVAALAVMVPAVVWLLRHVVEERKGTIVLSAIVAHTGWHWMEERWAVVKKYPWTTPAGSLAGAMKLVLVGMAVYAVVWAAKRARLLLIEK